ncbi:hypothetical protein C0J52_20683 [Blattella germanica]|nr:hypothetical protein C0J52_20683 [Blattella germanica]
MSSQNKESFHDIMGKLSDWSTQEIEENLEYALPVLLSVLKCPDQKVSALQAIHALLEKCLPCIPLDKVEDKLLQCVLSSSNQLFHEAIEGIHNRLQDNERPQDDELLENLNGLLQVCIELLNCIDYPLLHIQSLGKIEASLIPSIPKVTVSILQEAFKHCKESEKLYGELFQTMGEVLTKLFQRSHELQMKLLGLLIENLQFNCVFEDELLLLTEILETLGQIGQLVSGLDVKTMAEQWKAYARLAFQYVDHLKSRLDVAGTLQFLANDISMGLVNIFSLDPPDMKFIIRTVKIGSFTLKVIIKFCDQYNGYLGPCHEELLQMLLTMFRFSRPYLQIKNTPQDIIQNIETHVTIGAEPLIKHLILEPEFAEKFFSLNNKLADENGRLEFLFLCISILKKLIHCNQNERKLWMDSEPHNNIIFVLFRMLDHCHSEISLDLKISGVSHSGEPERMIDLYEYLTTHIAAFILSTSVFEFHLVEQVLLESILQPKVWRAMLAMDIWCIIARTGSSELCFQHMCHLAEILKCFSDHHGHLEKMYLMVLVDALTNVSQCIECYTPNQGAMISDLATHIVALWQRICLTSFLTREEANIKGSQWINYFITVLCSVTAPLTLHLNNGQLIKVLEKLKEILTLGSSSARLEVLTVLNSMANKFIDSTSDQIRVFQHISGLFTMLLQDENQIVHQKALEVFTYFAHVNSHDSILVMSVKNSVPLQQKTKQYLQKIPLMPPHSDILSFESYILEQSQHDFTHNCKSGNCGSKSEFERLNHELKVQDDVQPPKKPKLTSENTLNNAIERLKQEASTIENYCKTNRLSAAAKQEVLQVSFQLKNLC